MGVQFGSWLKQTNPDVTTREIQTLWYEIKILLIFKGVVLVLSPLKGGGTDFGGRS